MSQQQCQSEVPVTTALAKWTIGSMVRAYFPLADNKLVDYILWNHTCYPMCHPPFLQEGEDPHMALQRQVAEAAEMGLRRHAKYIDWQMQAVMARAAREKIEQAQQPPAPAQVEAVVEPPVPVVHCPPPRKRRKKREQTVHNPTVGQV